MAHSLCRSDFIIFLVFNLGSLEFLAGIGHAVLLCLLDSLCINVDLASRVIDAGILLIDLLASVISLSTGSLWRGSG